MKFLGRQSSNQGFPRQTTSLTPFGTTTYIITPTRGCTARSTISLASCKALLEDSVTLKICHDSIAIIQKPTITIGAKMTAASARGHGGAAQTSPNKLEDQGTPLQGSPAISSRRPLTQVQLRLQHCTLLGATAKAAIHSWMMVESSHRLVQTCARPTAGDKSLLCARCCSFSEIC
jgi:hypothetical protein